MNDVGGGVLIRKATSGQTAGLTLTDGAVTKNGTAAMLSVASYGGGLATANAALVLTRVTVSDDVAGHGAGAASPTWRPTGQCAAASPPFRAQKKGAIASP